MSKTKSITIDAQVRLDRIAIMARELLDTIQNHTDGIDMVSDTFIELSGTIDTLKACVDAVTCEEVDFDEGM